MTKEETNNSRPSFMEKDTTNGRVDRLRKAIRRATSAKSSNGESERDTSETEIDPILCRQVLNIVHNGPSEKYGPIAWEILFSILSETPNSKSRLLALLLSNELIKRSKAFRKSCFAHLRDIFEHVLYIPGFKELPPPPEAASQLHKTALKLMDQWKIQFGSENSMLALTCHFVSAKLGLVAKELSSRSNVAKSKRHLQEEKRALRTKRLLLAQFETVRNEMSASENIVSSIERTIEQVEASGRLLIEYYNTIALNSAQNESGKCSNTGSHSESDSIGSDGDDLGITWSTSHIADKSNTHAENLSKLGVDDDVVEWEAMEHSEHMETSTTANTVTASTSTGSSMGNALEKKLWNWIPASSTMDPNDEEANLLKQPIDEAVKEISRTYLPLVGSWVRVLSRVNVSELGNTQKKLQGKLMQIAVDLKWRLQRLMKLARSFGISVPEVSNYRDLYSVIEDDRYKRNTDKSEHLSKKRMPSSSSTAKSLRIANDRTSDESKLVVDPFDTRSSTEKDKKRKSRSVVDPFATREKPLKRR